VGLADIDIARHVVQRTLNPRLLSKIAPYEYDVASNIRQTLARGPAHPVLQALLERKRDGSKPGARSDGMRIGLAVEAGLTLVHFSAQPEPFLSLMSTESAQLDNLSYQKCSRQAEKWTNVSPYVEGGGMKGVISAAMCGRAWPILLATSSIMLAASSILLATSSNALWTLVSRIK